MKKEDVKNAVLNAAEEILGLPVDEMKDQMSLDLYDNGLIDSLGAVSMLNSINEALGIELDIQNLDPEAFRTLEALTEVIVKG